MVSGKPGIVNMIPGRAERAWEPAKNGGVY